jgi:hypothetical protein
MLPAMTQTSTLFGSPQKVNTLSFGVDPEDALGTASRLASAYIDSIMLTPFGRRSMVV